MYFTFVYDWVNVLQLIAVSFSIVFVLSGFSLNKRGLLRFGTEIVCVFAAETLFNWLLFFISHYWLWLAGINFPLAHFIVITLYAAFVSKYNVKSRILLSVTVFVTAIGMAELGVQAMRQLANPDFGTCRLGFPNREVQNGFLKMQLALYVPIVESIGSNVLIHRLYKAVDAGQPEEMMKLLDGLFANQNYQIQGDAEKNVQYAMSIIFDLLSQHVHTERQTSNGRIDLLLENKDYIYIIELKIDATADEALKQIEEVGYARPFVADPRKLFKIGVSFSTKTRRIEEWKIA